MTRRLHIVEQQSEPTDIYTDYRRHILSRDWSRVMIDADKRPPYATVLERRR